MIAAQQYYIEFCNDLDVEKLLTLLPNYIPDYLLTNGDKSVDRWATLIQQAYEKVRWNIYIFKSAPSRTTFSYYLNFRVWRCL